MDGSRRLRIFAGPNGSGKSTLYRALLEDRQFSPLPYINADEFGKQLNDGREVVFPQIDWQDVKSRLQLSPFFAKGLSISQIEALVIVDHGVRLPQGTKCSPYLAASLAEHLRSAFVSTGKSFAFETVMSHPSKIEFLKSARRSGYRIYLYFSTPGDPFLCEARVQLRVAQGEHDVPSETIHSRYPKVMGLLPQAVEHSDRAFLFDSSGAETVLVAEGEFGQLTKKFRSTTWLTEHFPGL